jgi:hypothetical protein
VELILRIAIIAAIIVFYAVAGRAMLRAWRLHLHGETVVGKVDRLALAPSPTGGYPIGVVRYSARNGRHTYFVRGSVPELRVGAKVSVRYLPQKPAVAALTDHRPALTALVVAATPFVCVLLVSGWLYRV